MPVISTAYTVSSGQIDSGNIIVGGGIESIVSGGKTIGTSITSGGVEIVSGGGIASGTIVSSGGVEYIRLGGTLAGATLSGGLIEIMSGGTAGTSEIDFAASAGGTLQLDDSRHFSGIISGFGVPGAIDLRDISFGAGTTLGYTDSGGSGTLTVQSGAQTATINLIGQYVQANFHAQNDGFGGTLITAPPMQGITGGVYIPHS